MKISKIITLFVIVLVFVVGVYFKNDIINFYNNFGKDVQDFEKTDIGQTISEVGKQIFTSSPLNVGGESNHIVLLQSKIIEETNLQRQENGDLPALKENTALNEAAVAKANDILLKQYFEHISPSGVGPGDLAQKYGYEYIIEGENLILGNFSSENEVVQDWMNSPGHRANILNNRYTEIGVAIIKGTYKGETVWVGVQEFGLPLSSCTQPSAILKNKIDTNNAELKILGTQIDETKIQIDNINSHSAIYSQMIDNYNKLVAQYNELANQTKSIIATYNDLVNNFNNCLAGNK